MLSTGEMLTVGTILIGFVGQTMYFKGAFGARMDRVEKDVDDIKKNVRYKDTCDAYHEEVDRRLGNLDKKTGLNGSAQPATDTR